MLIPRIISALVMALLFVCAVFVLDERGFILAMGGVVMLAAWEWARLSGVVHGLGRILFALLIALLCYALLSAGAVRSSLYLAPVLWLLALTWVMRYPQQLIWRQRLARLA